MKKRDARYEFIRVVSMLLVIGTHSFATVSPSYREEFVWGGAVSVILLLCNGLFFMISGKFALSVCCQTNKDYRTYYLKRLGSIGIPVLIGMLLREMFNNGWYIPYLVSGDFVKVFIRNVLSGFSSCEYWFLYTLVGLLVAAPFVGKLLQQASEVDLYWLIGICIFWNTLDNYLPAFGLDFAWGFPLRGWFVLFVLGYALERLIRTKKEQNILFLLGAASFAISLLLLRIGLDKGVSGFAPTYAVMVSAVFMALKMLYRPGKIADAVVLQLGKLSLTVYLLHMIVLYTVLPFIPQWPVPIRATVLWVVTAVVTLCVSFVLERTIIAGLQWLYRKIVRLP